MYINIKFACSEIFIREKPALLFQWREIDNMRCIESSEKNYNVIRAEKIFQCETDDVV